MLVTVYLQKKGIMKQVIYTVYYSVCFAIKLHPLNLIVQTQSDISLSVTRRKKNGTKVVPEPKGLTIITVSQGSVTIKEPKTRPLLTYSVFSLAVFRQAQRYLHSISALGSCSGNDC